MTSYPNVYNKKKFIDFLFESGVNVTIINKLKSLPEKIEKHNITYELYINITWHDEGKTHYDFEVNYYSEDKLEFLFPYKIFTDPEKSIDFVSRNLDK